MLDNKDQSGVVIFVTALVLAVLLLVFVGVVQIGYYFLVRAELRAAVRAAASTSAHQMCSTKSCYELAHFAPLQVIQLFPVHSGFGRSTEFKLNITGANAYDSEWPTVDGLGTVGIEIGRWVSAGGFEPFDQNRPGLSDPNWQADHPGVPRFAAMNAVRVYATRTINSTILNLFLGSGGVRQEMIFVADMPQPHQVAPFAMPICHLIGNNGDYSPPSLCFGERYFTAADHYCGGAPCNLVPTFTWEPLTPNVFLPVTGVWTGPAPGANLPSAAEIAVCNSTIKAAAPASSFTCDFVSDTRCNWDTPHYPQPSDNYGVIGIPGVSAAAEGTIASLLAPGSLPFSGIQLNDSFQILYGGLTLSATEDAVWSMMSGIDSWNTTIPIGSSELFKTAGLPWQQLFEYNKYSSDGSGTAYDCSALTPSSTSTGLCNSRRFGPHPVLEPENGIPGVGYGTQANPEYVWRQEIPVIADWNNAASPCQTGASDLTIAPGGDWRIIGFVQAHLFDVDIGNPPPSGPGFDPAPPFYDGMIWPYPAMPAPGGPWGFPTSCNLVRAVLPCSGDFLPGNQAGYYYLTMTGPVQVE